MMRIHFILWRKCRRNVKLLNHCLAIWTLLCKLGRVLLLSGYIRCETGVCAKWRFISCRHWRRFAGSLSKGQINNICGVWFIQSKSHHQPGWILKLMHSLWLLKATTRLLMSPQKAQDDNNSLKSSASKLLKVLLVLLCCHKSDNTTCCLV